MKPLLAALVVFVSLLIVSAVARAQSLELKQGDHVCIIGNALGDRMQHHGWLETLLVRRFADKDLVFRNLAVNYLGQRDLPDADIEPADTVGNGTRDRAPLLPLELPAEASPRARRRGLRVVGG